MLKWGEVELKMPLRAFVFASTSLTGGLVSQSRDMHINHQSQESRRIQTQYLADTSCLSAELPSAMRVC